jgi:hypothetical protein
MRKCSNNFGYTEHRLILANNKKWAWKQGKGALLNAIELPMTGGLPEPLRFLGLRKGATTIVRAPALLHKAKVMSPKSPTICSNVIGPNISKLGRRKPTPALMETYLGGLVHMQVTAGEIFSN